MRGTTVRLAAVTLLAAMPLAVYAPARGEAPAYKAGEAEALAVRAAQADGLNRLTRMVLDAETGTGQTVGEVLGGGTPDEIALRVFLRGARMVGPPRVYSDGVVEVDVEVPADVVAAKVADLCGLAPGGNALEGLRRLAVEGCLSTTGCGRAPPGLPRKVVRRVLDAPPERLPEMFPVGWERVTATGRVLAMRAARVAAYEAIADRIRGLLLTQTEAIGDLITEADGGQGLFEAYVRGLSVTGRPRFMPDRIAEVTVAAEVRRLIGVLKDIRRLPGAASPWTDRQIDRLSVRLKSESISAVGRGMPPPEEMRPAAPAPILGAPLPDWATRVLEVCGKAALDPDAGDPERVRLLAARSAKARAMVVLERQVDAIELGDGQTVRQRAAKDAVFRHDLETFLRGARTTRYRPVDGGRAWEVVVALPLMRLYEFSRRGE